MKKFIPLLALPFALAGCPGVDEPATPPVVTGEERTADKTATIIHQNIYSGRTPLSEGIVLSAIGNPNTNPSFPPAARRPPTVISPTSNHSTDGYIFIDSEGTNAAGARRYDRGEFVLRPNGVGYSMTANTYICLGDIPASVGIEPKFADAPLPATESEAAATYVDRYLQGCNADQAYVSMTVNTTDRRTFEMTLLFASGRTFTPVIGSVQVLQPGGATDGGMTSDAGVPTDSGFSGSPSLFGQLGRPPGLTVSLASAGFPVRFDPSTRGDRFEVSSAPISIRLAGGSPTSIPSEFLFQINPTIRYPALLFGTTATLSALVPPEAQYLLYTLVGFHRVTTQTSTRALDPIREYTFR